ncbi:MULTISPECIES: hypothetical protein [Bacillus]|uniref:hypothetical protein n=1 Tax=Bacillus TaxID=1386 RepID=UPI000BFDDF4F|nr:MULTISPECIES: hypothetical protein [Bacillus]MCR6850045.1 hypothetical protein [Bacillus sp. IBL03825]PGK38677.1 hypothetical protein CN908_17070 [Bacillus thuringiensis]
MEKVKFIKLTDWALLPMKEIVSNEQFDDAAFRWNKKRRVKGACWPYKMAKEIGWTVFSSIDVEIHPVTEMQVQCKNQYELEELHSLTDIDFWVKRDQGYIGVKPDGWFRVHQAKVDGVWQCMFIPNGEGSFEWKLGWGIEIPDDYMLLFQPLENQEAFIVHPGLLPAKRLSTFNRGLGLPIAFEPKTKKTIRRGDPIAKLLVLHKSAMSLNEEIIDKTNK